MHIYLFYSGKHFKEKGFFSLKNLQKFMITIYKILKNSELTYKNTKMKNMHSIIFFVFDLVDFVKLTN